MQPPRLGRHIQPIADDDLQFDLDVGRSLGASSASPVDGECNKAVMEDEVLDTFKGFGRVVTKEERG